MYIDTYRFRGRMEGSGSSSDTNNISLRNYDQEAESLGFIDS